eukprot:TRINITY_DN9914_c0_g1_i1.p1 TRINITY_DN9914_c0_g1~~TRINITY_DN9914_c0_g1_i1.p1  ORF type:complete len:620 (+),score=182.64 TRINITY_DN9914_c0_g1_i1:57-1862(+)
MHCDAGPTPAAAAAPVAAARAGGQRPFGEGIAMLRSCSEAGIELGLLLRDAHAHRPGFDASAVSDDDLSLCVRQLDPGEQPQVRLRAAHTIRAFLSQQTAATQTERAAVRAVEHGVVPPLLRAFSHDRDQPELRYEAAWALVNLCGSKGADAVADGGGVACFVAGLSEPNLDISDQSAWALSHLARSSASTRDSCLEHGALDALLKVVRGYVELLRDELKGVVSKRPWVSPLRNCIWAVADLFCFMPHPPIQVVQRAVVVLVELMLLSEDSETRCNALWGLAFCCADGAAEYVQAILDAGALPHVITSLTEPQSLSIPAARALHGISRGTVAQVAQLQQTGAFAGLKSVLDRVDDEDVLLLSCSTVDIFARAGLQSLTEVLEVGLLESCVRIVRRDVVCSETGPRGFAATAVISVLLAASDDQLAAAGDQGAHLACYTVLCEPALFVHHLGAAAGFQRVLSAGGRRVYLRHGGAELTDACALLADVGICAESVVVFVSAGPDFAPMLECDGPRALPVYVQSAGGGKLALDVPGDGTVGDLCRVAATRFRELGWSISCPPADRNRFAREILDVDEDAAEMLARRRCDEEAAILSDVLREYFE